MSRTKRKPIAKSVPVFLPRTQLEQLAWYINRMGEGDALYYGNRKQFNARHEAICDWIKRELEVTK